MNLVHIHILITYGLLYNLRMHKMAEEENNSEGDKEETEEGITRAVDDKEKGKDLHGIYKYTLGI